MPRGADEVPQGGADRDALPEVVVAADQFPPEPAGAGPAGRHDLQLERGDVADRADQGGRGRPLGRARRDPRPAVHLCPSERGQGHQPLRL